MVHKQRVCCRYRSKTSPSIGAEIADVHIVIRVRNHQQDVGLVAIISPGIAGCTWGLPCTSVMLSNAKAKSNLLIIILLAKRRAVT